MCWTPRPRRRSLGVYFCNAAKKLSPTPISRKRHDKSRCSSASTLGVGVRSFHIFVCFARRISKSAQFIAHITCFPLPEHPKFKKIEKILKNMSWTLEKVKKQWYTLYNSNVNWVIALILKNTEVTKTGNARTGQWRCIRGRIRFLSGALPLFCHALISWVRPAI